MKSTQAHQVLNYMKKHGSITSLDAFRDIGCTRLSGRIFDLKKEGYVITKEMIKVPTRDGETWVAEYRLNEESPAD